MNPRRYLPRELPAGLEPLVGLALDLRWSWSHDADELWRHIDPRLWDATQNPWLVLESASARRLRTLARNREFVTGLRKLAARRERYLRQPTWFKQRALGHQSGRIAFFSMEFAVGEAVPIYSGGLGVLAGDFLKSASDLGVPVLGVGLLYEQGYFRQALDARGEQMSFYPYNPRTMMPVTPLRDRAGEWAHVVVELPGRELFLRSWHVKVGRVSLYLLDSNDPMNSPRDRSITAALYAPGEELRLQQEIVLGIGGWRLLEAVGDEIAVCHLNEGHAAFAVIARALEFRRSEGGDFDRALWATRAGNIFTTHTPVSAGFDQFEPSLVGQYMASYRSELGLSERDFLALGRANADADREPFNMAYLAARGSARVNGVSAIHGEISRRIFQPLFPRWPPQEVPVSHVTNGVHTPTWESRPAAEVWSKACGGNLWERPLDGGSAKLRDVADAELWRMRGEARKRLVTFVRECFRKQEAARGRSPSPADSVMDPDTLTLGFARRFATYKRPTLLLRDPRRLTRLLLDGQRPVQLVVAGKAHPADEPGRALVRAWAEFAERPEIRGRVVFIEDYDLRIAGALVAGVDLWINTPRRPMEASGTSGMKVLANGGLNLSSLDGWWPEAYATDVGWALGDAGEHDESRDGADAEALYRTLEQEVVPLFYDRDASGAPVGWLARVRESMSRLTYPFSTHRMLVEYTERFYRPLSEAIRARTAEGARLADELTLWRRAIDLHWPRIRFGRVTSERKGDRLRFEAQLYVGELPPESVTVELYAEGLAGQEPVCAPMRARASLVGSESAIVYEGEVSGDRPAADYTPRARPFHARAILPAEAPFITWAS